MRYLSLLRGINVGGKKVPMAELKAVYEELGFKNIVTYIQSGNVIFESKLTKPSLTKMMEQTLLKKFGFEIPVILRTMDELKTSIKANPFTKEKSIVEDKLYVIFLKKPAEPTLVTKLTATDLGPERFSITEKEIYLYCPVGYGEAKLNNNFFEKKLKVVATTRNWRTTNILSAMMNKE